MAVRQADGITQVGVLEDDVLVEHFVASESSRGMVGNVYLGRVQNVLPSMEAAFIDIGPGRNAVLYAGEVNWDASGLEGKPRLIEHALSPGQLVLVQVTKDPVGTKGARLTSQISLAGRFVVFVPDGSLTGISRKLPDAERKRLREILERTLPEEAGVIVRTAAEGASESDLTRDIERLRGQWERIQSKSEKATSPTLLHQEPDMLLRVVRDLFNEDVSRLVVQGGKEWSTVRKYVAEMAPDLVDRLEKHTDEVDLFTALRIDEQIAKALERKVWLPSGGYLIIDRTEAMTVVDVNTGKFTGQGGNLEETVTKNNLEAADEIVRQLRLRDVGGIIVIDFIDMVLPANRDLVLRRLVECLSRDRTRHQVAEVTSLGLVQMTRKRVGAGLLDTFGEPCSCCNGRGIVVHGTIAAAEQSRSGDSGGGGKGGGSRGGSRNGRKRGRSESASEAASAPAAEEAVDPEVARRNAQAVAAVAAAAAGAAEPAGEPAGERRVNRLVNRHRAARTADVSSAAERSDLDLAANQAVRGMGRIAVERLERDVHHGVRGEVDAIGQAEQPVVGTVQRPDRDHVRHRRGQQPDLVVAVLRGWSVDRDRQDAPGVGLTQLGDTHVGLARQWLETGVRDHRHGDGVVPGGHDRRQYAPGHHAEHGRCRDRQQWCA